jgi:hypothetical protein
MSEGYFGRAYKVADLAPAGEISRGEYLWAGWHEGCALYYVEPAIDAFHGGYYGFTHYVVAAYTPHAADHGKPETTLFAGSRTGQTYRLTALDGEAEVADGACRIVGKNDHAAALAVIGYELMPRRARPVRKARR